MKYNTKLCLLATLGVVGLGIAATGLSFLHFYPIIFNEQLKEQTRLEEGTAGYANWKDPPSNIFIDFYVWHLENPLEVENGSKPNVTQRGPYTYKENRVKQFVEDNGNGTLSYVQPQSFIFDPVHSIGDPTKDTFTTINMPLLTMINQFQYMPENIQYLFDILATLVIKNIHGTFTVHDFIWGYFSPLLALAKLVEPDMVPTTEFGIYTGKNNSNDGVYTVYDGVEDCKKTNVIDKWDGMSILPYWSTEYANMVNGTDGTYFPQFLQKKDEVYIFVSDLCRSVFTTFERAEKTRGIPTWRFTTPKEMFENHFANPDNVGFCTPDKDHCIPGGLLNISLCKFGAPIYFSAPNFLYADQEVLDMVNGVHPDKEKHETFLSFEPYTGSPLNVSKRSQINTHLQSYQFIEFYKHVKEAYLPLVWMDERSVITQAAADEISSSLMVPLTIGDYLPWGMFGLGMAIMLLGVGCFGHHWRKERSLMDGSLQVEPNERTPLLG